jgi:flagellar hook-associated protein 3 FlgL
MELRVTPQVRVNQALYNTQIQTAQLAHLQQEASTGSKLLLPSDDPLATVAVMTQKAQSLRLDTYKSNVDDGTSTLNGSVSALQEVSSLFDQARSLAIQGTDSTLDPASRNSLASQVDSILNRLVQLANSQNAGHYYYSGTASTTQPFQTTSFQGQITGVTYNGSSQAAQILVGPKQTVDTLYTGSTVFQPRTRGTTTYAGPIGAAPGTGTDSATGQGTLIATHTLTTFGGASGVQAGTNSVAGDTVLGPAGTNNLVINDTSGTGASGTISLNGGPPVNFTNTDTNLLVADSNGSAVYVNTTAITPAFNGTVPITSTGTLSVDNGATSTPITFSGNQVLTNGSTGAVTNVNTTNIRQTGTDTINYTGSFDAFQALIALRDDLQNAQKLPDSQVAQNVSQRLTEIDRVHNGILGTVGEQSASLLNLDGISKRVQDVQLSTQGRIGDLESADIASVVVSLQAQQNLLQLTLYSSSKIFDQSLLNFLR